MIATTRKIVVFMLESWANAYLLLCANELSAGFVRGAAGETFGA
jgi:hypothetical protein